jgi:predicted CXXCH cytochrome family protein
VSAAASSWLVLALAALAQGREPVGPAPSAADLGAERCVDCHAATVEAYGRTGMARALGPLAAGELDGLERVESGLEGLSYHFEGGAARPEGGAAPAWIVESRPAGAEEPRQRRSARLDFAIGAGLLDRSFAAQLDGRLWFAPLEVLSADGERPRRAALAPGQAIAPGLGFESPITGECLDCHTDRPPPRDYPANLAPAPASGWTPRGISCAACHGAAEAHADWREAELGGGAPTGSDPILRHGELTLEERLSVCARCHLQGDARFALQAGERGLPPPGGDLLERLAVFVPARPDDDLAFVSQVERLVASPCYLASRRDDDPAAGLACETCHDPHRSTADARERRRVRDGCLVCHAGGETDESGRSACALPRAERGPSDCASCHMPLEEVFDLPHVRVHDHRIARVPPQGRSYAAPRIKHSRDGELAAFTWPGRPPPELAGDPGLALMAAVAAGFPQRALPLLDSEPEPRVQDLATYQHLRALLLEGQGRFAEAAEAYGAALSRDRGHVESAVNLALVLGRLGRAREGIELATRVLELHPAADGALRNRALLHLELGDRAAARADLEAAYALRPLPAVARALEGL